jgi:hypothetical protein
LEASAGQVAILEFKFGQPEQVNCNINVHGVLSFQRRVMEL